MSRFFCPKPKDNQFNMIQNREKQEMSLFERLKTAFSAILCMKDYLLRLFNYQK